MKAFLGVVCGIVCCIGLVVFGLSGEKGLNEFTQDKPSSTSEVPQKEMETEKQVIGRGLPINTPSVAVFPVDVRGCTYIVFQTGSELRVLHHEGCINRRGHKQ